MKEVCVLPRAILSFLLFLASAGPVAATDLPDSVRGFKPQTLEVYFNRADQERASADWERVARFGAEAAVSQWEREAAQLYSEPQQVSEARGQLSTWVGGEMQARYESWLTRRFFEQQGSLRSDAIVHAIADANLQYLYITDDSGKIQLDESGDPILRAAEGLQSDRESWHAKVGAAADVVLAAWEQKVDAAFAPELSGLLGTESLARFQEYKVGMKAGLRREMERVSLQAELSLVSRRLYDQYSLRKKSEAATADAIVEQLVRETRTQTDEGIAAIAAGLSTVPESVDSSAASVDVDRWIESFKAVFESGLSRWDAAEEKFLAGRMEWEQDAGKSYTDGEKAWADAYQRLSTERRSWEQQVDMLLQTGAARWDLSRSDLSESIESARSEFQKERDERIGGMQDQVGALVDMYAQSQQVISTAVSSGQELMRKLGIKDANGEYVKFAKDVVPALAEFRRQKWAGYISKIDSAITNTNKEIADYQKNMWTWLLNGHWEEYLALKNACEARLTSLTDLRTQLGRVNDGGSVQGANPALEQALLSYTNYLEQSDGNSTAADAVRTDWERLGRAGDWLTMVDTYGAQAAKAREGLQNALGSAFGTDATDLRDVLKSDVDSGIAYLDEYQLELLRAKAVQDYWSQRKAIADSVVTYAQDISSGRQTADQGARAFEAAQASYEVRLAEYNRVVGDLMAGGIELSAARAALEEAQTAADAASTDYEEARQKYLDALVTTQSGSVEFYRGQIEEKYGELLDAAGMSGNDTELADATTSYFAAARRFGYDLAVQVAWDRASELVHGNPESGLASIGELRNESQGIQVPDSPAAILSTAEQFGLPLDSPDFARVSALFSEWRDAPAGDQKDLAGWKLVHCVGILKADAEAAYAERLAQVTAYGAADADAWYVDAGGQRTSGRVEDRLSADSVAATLGLIAARAAVEQRGLEAWLLLQSGQIPSDQDATMLARLAPSGLSQSEAVSRIEALQALTEALRGSQVEVSAAASRLREKISGGGWIQAFVTGQGSFLDPEAGDLVLALCGGQYQEEQQARGRSAAWAAASAESTASVDERQASALEGIGKVFRNHGMTLGANGVLPTSEELAVAVKARGASSAAGFVSELSQELQAAALDGPQWLADRVRDYCDALYGYAAADAVREGAQQSASAKAAEAQKAVTVASEDADHLRSVAGALQGEGRLAALVGLYNSTNDPPSASAVSARSLIVEAAAVQTAKRSLASPELPLYDIALDLAPGMTASLVHDIAQRAAELLETDTGIGTAGQRVTAFRTWNTVRVSDAVSGIQVNPLAAEAKVLWEEVASRSWPDQQSLRDAVRSYLSKFDAANPTPDSILDLCQRLESGLESPDALFRSFLFGDDFSTRLASFDSMGAAGEVYKRAAALSIASRMDGTTEGRALAGFLRDRTGIQSAADAEKLAGSSFDLTTSAFSGAGDLAIEYLCKSFLYSGSAIPKDVEDLLSARPAVHDEVDSYRNQLQKARGYLAALDGPALSYAQGLGGGFQAEISLASSIAAGQWNDEFFAARADTDYLTWCQGLIDTSLDAASQVVLQELAQKCMALGAESQKHSAEASYWRQVEDTASRPASWRGYLVETNVGATHVVGSASTAQTRDTDAYVREAGVPLENLALEAFNLLAGQENAFVAQLAADPGDRRALTGFAAFLESFAAGTSQEADLPAPVEQGLESAESSYRSALARVEGLKEDIRRFGDALSFLDLGTPDRQRQLDALKQAMDAAAGVAASRQVTVDSALATFETNGEAYNGLSARLQDSAQQLQRARFSLRTQEEIQDWASNGYLASSGELTNSYQSPVQGQADAAQKLLRATAALDALKELYGGSTVTERPVGDTATLAAYEAWKASYAQLLRLDKAAGELEEASSEQAKKVEEQYTALQDAREMVLKWKEADGNLGSEWSSDASERATSWASYLMLKDGGLSLNISADFKLQTQSSETEWQSVKDYFEKRETQAGDPPESAGKSAFERGMESWLLTMDTLSKRAGGMDALINRWGFAADWLRRRMYDANNADATIGTAVKSLLTHYSSDNDFLRASQLVGYKGPSYSNDSSEFVASAVATSYASYVAVTGDPTEQEAFAFYLALRMASGTGEWTDQFDTRTSTAALGAFSRSLQDRVNDLRGKASAPFAFLVDWAFGWSRDADVLSAVNNDKIKPILNGFSYTVGSAMKSSASSFKQATASYESGCSVLSRLRGTNGIPLAGIDSFLLQYKDLLASRAGIAASRVTIPSDLESSFRSCWSRLGTDDKASFNKALRKMESLGKADSDDAHRLALLAAQGARQDEIEAQQAYRTAFDAFLAGTVTQADLVAAAQRAYRDSAWVGKAEQALASDVLDNASFSAGTLLNGVETNARLDAVQRYAQSILSAYAAALDSRGTALEQEWDQSVQDLGDRRQSWYAQVGLVRAKAASSWEASQQKLVRTWGEWRQGFEQEYTQKSEAWRMAYLNMGERKLEWVQEVQQKGSQAGNEAILSEVGSSADDSSRSASTTMIGQMSFDGKEVSLRVEGLLGEVGSAQALTALRRMNAGIAIGQTVVVASGHLGVDTSGARIAAEVKRFLQSSRSELSALAACGIADEAQESVQEAKKALTEGVKKANEGFESSMDEVFVSESYTKSGGEYRRETIVRSTLFENAKTETARVGTYRWYAMPALQLKVDLSEGRLNGLGAEAVMDLVGVAQQEVASAQKKIFGDGEKLSEGEKKAKGLLVEFSANGATVKKEQGEGEFGKHIGYAPEFNKEPDFDKSQDRNIVVTGTGELGRLMGSFIWNQMKESRGWAEMAEPPWDKPLWDDTGSWFKAPNLRTVGTMGAAVIAAIVPGGQGLTAILTAAAITTASTVLFDSLDVAYGYKTWEEAGLDIGKTFLTSAVTSTIGVGFKAVGSAWSGAAGTFGEIGKGVVGKTLLAGAQSFTTNTATSAINAVSWSNGGLSWNNDAFTEGAFGTSAWGSVAGAAGAAGTSTLLTGNLIGFNRLHAEDVSSVANLAGGFASSGIEYGISGQTTLNVLRLAGGSGDNAWGVGLMEMHLGGSQGFGMNLGSNGTDVSLSTIGRAMAGMGTFVKQQEFNWYEVAGGVQYAADYTGSREVGTQLRENYSFGDRAALVQQERLLSGQDTLRVGYFADPGQTTAVGDSRVVDLATLGQRGNIASQLAAGTVMQHEAYRNGIDDGILGQAYETQIAALGHTQMALRVAKEYGYGFIAQNANLTKDVETYMQGPEAFAKYIADTYDSSADYWRVKKDGKLINDHRKGLIQELADGSERTIVSDDQEESVAAALVHYLGASRANQLLNREYGDPFNRGDLSSQVSLYDDQTLRDVLHLSDAQIAGARNNPSAWQDVIANVSPLEKDRLVGEALMKGNGITASGQDWLGEGYGFTLSDNRFADGTIGLRRLDDGQLEKFTVSAMAVRSSSAFGLLSRTGNEWQVNQANNRNTSITFTKQDLDGNELGRYETGLIWNTVDNGYGQIAHTADEMMSHYLLGQIQGNTINSDSMIRLVNSDPDKWGVDKVFKITNASTISGDLLNHSGSTANGSGGWLWHPAGLGTNNGCWVTLNSQDFAGIGLEAWKDPIQAGSGAYNFRQVTDYLQNQWGIYTGLDVNVRLQNRNPWAWTGFGRR